MTRTMKLSGAETLSASANIFLGQTEAPLLIKPYLQR
jgi:CNT family concentrative nucleoside transporter